MGFDNEPRILQFDLSEVNCFFVLPSIKDDYTEDNPPYVNVAMWARCNGVLGEFVAGKITLDGIWLSRPQIRESILVAGYYIENSRIVDFPEKLTLYLERAICALKSFFAPAFEYNRDLLLESA